MIALALLTYQQVRLSAPIRSSTQLSQSRQFSLNSSSYSPGLLNLVFSFSSPMCSLGCIVENLTEKSYKPGTKKINNLYN